MGGGSKGLAVGGVIGAPVDVLTGLGVILTGAAGAVFGGLVAKLHDSDFDNKNLKNFISSLTPESSTLLAVVEDNPLGEFANLMTSGGAQVIHDALNPKLTGELNSTFESFVARF